MNGYINRRYSGRVNRPVGSFEQLEVIEDKKTKKKSYLLKFNPPVRDDNEKVVAELDVDQFSGQSFMQNANGFITNDIMVFEQCQSDSVARAVLNRLKVLHPQSLPQNMSVDEMMATAIPANYGSPSEFVNAHKHIVEKVYKLHAEEAAIYAQQMQAVKDAQMQKDVSELEKSVPNHE